MPDVPAPSLPPAYTTDGTVWYDLQPAIASGQQASAEVLVAGRVIVGVFVPAGFTGTALSFQAATDPGGTFVSVLPLGGGAAASFTVAAGQYLPLDPALLLGVRHLKVVSGSAEAAARTLVLAARAV